MFIEEQENLVEEETTENVEEQTTEENVEDVEVPQEETPTQEPVEEKKYTDKELDEILARKIAYKESRLRKEYDKKYSRLENVLTKGLQTKNIEEATQKLEDACVKKGINLNDEPKYNEKELKLIANAEADEIISYGYEEIKEEVDRLAEIGLENMSDRDKIIFTKLATERKRIEDEKVLSSIGVSKDALNSKEFTEFESKLNPSLSRKEKYELFLKLNPKKSNEPIGSMKNTEVKKVKEYYSPEEISRLTDEDLDDPQVWEAVRKSMTRNS